MPLMDMGFALIRPFARHRMPLIRFLYIGSYVCSTLLSDLASRRRRCASLSLHLHQVVKGTFTPKLSNMLGTHEKPRLRKQPGFSSLHLQKLILPNTVVLERACGDEDGSLSILGLCSDFYVSKRLTTFPGSGCLLPNYRLKIGRPMRYPIRHGISILVPSTIPTPAS